MRILAAVVTFAILVSAPIRVCAGSLDIELNAANIEDVSGLEMGVGYNFENSRFRITPSAGGFLYEGENTRYYWDHMSNGQTRCRDSENGHFANDSDCKSGEFSGFVKIEGAVKFNDNWEAGLGIRSGEEATPYFTLIVKGNKVGYVRSFVGKNYYGIGGGLRF